MDSNSELLALGKRIKAVRASKNLTQNQLAHKINRDREAISRIERGKTNPTYLILLELSKALEINISDLLK